MSVIFKEDVYTALTMDFKKNIVFVASNNSVTNFLFWVIFVPHLAKVNDIVLTLYKTF